jgi:hypothetical protein
MKSTYFFHAKKSALRRLLCVSALIACALPAGLLADDAPFNTNPHGPYADDDLSVRPLTAPVTYRTNANTDPRIYGKVGPLLVMHAMSVHNTMVWKTNDDTPKMLMFQRHSGYSADEVANPDIINFLLANTNPATGQAALGNSGNQFNSAYRRSFQQLCYGGYNIIHDVSQSVATRTRVDQNIEVCQLYDWGHPDAYKYDTADPKYSPCALNNHDAELNFGATKNMGPSRGLYYDMYCPGFCTLEDGRPIFPGGHDMNSQNGNYRFQVYNPDTEAWLQRPVSCMRLQYNSDPNDPYSEKFFQSKIDLGLNELNVYFPIGNSTNNDCNPHALANIPGINYSTNYPKIRLMGPTGTVTQPDPQPGDMKYARWYPGCVALPGNRAMVFGGWDRDEVTPPSRPALSATTTALTNFFYGAAATNYNLPTNWLLSGFLSSSGNDVPGTQITQPVPEIYDGTQDKTYALENARLIWPAWYPNSCVVQTGPNEDDWKVLVNSALIFEDAAEAGGELGTASSETAARNSFLIDVLGALSDPDRSKPNVREGKWIQYVDTATNTFAPFSANVDMEELDTAGQVVTHKLYHFGGRTATGSTASNAVVIELAGLAKARLPGDPPQAMPKWTNVLGNLYQRARQNYACPLPNGQVIIIGGNGAGFSTNTIEDWSMHVQLFDPATGLISKMDKSGVPRDEHGIIHLWPDGRIFMGGQNRNGICVSGDPFAPSGDSDMGVTCAQFYTPPYLYDANTNEPVRPVITSYPKQIDYGLDFNVAVDDASKISNVCIIRTGSMSHGLCTDRRYVKLPYSSIGGNVLRVTAPVLPGTAVGGYYLLFVTGQNGTPAMGKKVILGTQIASRKW